jgi:hypothetical protein
MNISLIILDIIIFIIIVLFGLIVARVLSNISKKIIDEFEINKAVNTKYAPEIIKYVVYFFTIIIALDALGIKLIAFRIFIVLIMIFIVLTILITLGDIIPNYLFGLRYGKKYKIGDSIKVRKVSGKIISKNLTDIVIKSKSENVHIPYVMLK